MSVRHRAVAVPCASAARVFEIGSQRSLFDVPDEVAYFNAANMSPLLGSVREAGAAALDQRAQPWKIGSADWFTDVERLRGAYAGVLGVEADGVALVPATSYGLAVAARNIDATAGDQVVVLADEYPSNYYTWRRFCERTGAELLVARRDADGTWADAVIAAGRRAHARGRGPERALDRRLARRPRCRDPGRAPRWGGGGHRRQPVARRASAGVERLRPDFVVSVGYKWLLGPLGVGCLYVDERHRDGEPIEENWINRAGAEDFAGLVDYAEDLPPRCPPVRRGRAHELWARADGDRGLGAVARVDRSRRSR